LGGGRSGAIGRDAQRPGRVIVCPGRGTPWSCFHRNSGYRRSTSTLVCGIEHPIWRVWRSGVSVQVSTSSGCHRDVVFPSGWLGHGGSSAGFLLVPPSFTLLRGSYFSRGWCREIHPSSHSFNRFPEH
jgi:hypothetical protein